jgi:hypothetical protein
LPRTIATLDAREVLSRSTPLLSLKTRLLSVKTTFLYPNADSGHRERQDRRIVSA